MSLLRLYAPALVMLVWAIVGVASVQGFGLQLLAIFTILWSLYLHVAELFERRHRRDYRT